MRSLVKRLIVVAALGIVLLAAVATPALAREAGGNGKGHALTTASCVVAGNWVDASGLPTNQVINFLITDASGTNGWVLGFTSDGTWSVNVPAQNGATTYQFVSETSGPNGSKYNVFASC